MRKKHLLVAFICYTIFVVVMVLIPSRIPSDNDWIGYYGSVFGGAITLIGVYITLDYNKKEKEKYYVKSIMPILSGKIEIFTYDEIEKWHEGRGAILEISSTLAGNGEAYDKSVLEKYKNIGDRNLKIKFVRYRLVNLSSHSANKILVKNNGIKLFENFSILPQDEVIILFIMHLDGTDNNEFAKLKLTFEFEDELGKKRYRQEDEMNFYKDGNGSIYNSCKIAAMTSPEEITND